MSKSKTEKKKKKVDDACEDDGFVINDICYISGSPGMTTLDGTTVAMAENKNGTYCQIIKAHTDTEEYTVISIPDGSKMLAPEEYLEKVPLGQALKHFKKDFCINKMIYKVHGSPQGGNPLMLVKNPNGSQFGMVSVGKCHGSAVAAFQVACVIMQQMVDSKIEFSKSSFYTTREDMLEKYASTDDG